LSQVDCFAQCAAIQALIPELRIAARDLANESTLAPDDLVRDVLIVALRNWDRLPSGDNLKPWLLGVLRDPDLVQSQRSFCAR